MTNSYQFNATTFGLLGNITLALNGNHTLGWTAKIGKNGTGTNTVVGYGYFSDVQSISVPINLISYIGTFLYYSIGDTVNIEIYAQNVGGGSDPTIVTPPQLIQGVYNAVTNKNVVLPPPGILTPTLTGGPTAVEPTSTYTVSNTVGTAINLYVYPTSTLTRTFSQLIDVAASSTPVTGNNYIDIATASPPPPPSGATFNGGEAPYSAIVTNSQFTFAAGVDTQTYPGSVITSMPTEYGTGGESWTLYFTAPNVGLGIGALSQTFPPNVDGFYVQANAFSGETVGVRLYTGALELTIGNGIDPDFTATYSYNIGDQIKITFNGISGETNVYIGGVLQTTSLMLGQAAYSANFKAQAITTSPSPMTVSGVLFINSIV